MTKHPITVHIATDPKTEYNDLRFSYHGLRRVSNFLKMLHRWHNRARERRMLLKLDNTALKDIGISRADAVHEGDKPFWRC
jgi:uncharacterized protein YjiS (DUF1127 family)